VQFAIGREVGIEGLQRLKEALLLFNPWARMHIVPALFSKCGTECPIEKIPHVRENLQGGASGTVVSGEGFRSPLKSACGPIGERGEGMA
jgi:hypothetical protein